MATSPTMSPNPFFAKMPPPIDWKVFSSTRCLPTTPKVTTELRHSKRTGRDADPIIPSFNASTGVRHVSMLLSTRASGSSAVAVVVVAVVVVVVVVAGGAGGAGGGADVGGGLPASCACAVAATSGDAATRNVAARTVVARRALRVTREASDV